MNKTERDKYRCKVGWEVVSQQGNMSRLAERLGVTTAFVSIWVRQYPDLRKALLDGRHAGNLSDEQTDRRANLVALVRLGKSTWAYAGRQEGVTSAAIINWARRHDDEIREVICELTSVRRMAA